MPSYPRPPRQQRGDQPAQPPRPSGVSRVAHAPYNFVPLPAELAEWQSPPPADCYDLDRFTGHLELDITAETPLYIRGTVGPDHPADGATTPDFFSPTGRPAIPGSSLRGMLRALVEIAGASPSTQIHDDHYSYRAVAEQTDSALTNLYRRRLGQVQAGYLQRDSGGLSIVPARRHGQHKYWRVRLDLAGELLGGNPRDPGHAFERRQVFFLPVTAKPGDQRAPLLTDVVPKADAPGPDGYVEGWLIVSGPMQGKKHAWVVAAPDPSSTAIAVDADDERTYRAGWSPLLESLDAAGAFRLLPRAGESLPCFFTFWPDETGRRHVTLGHTRWFRVPYEHGVRSRTPTPGPPPGWDLAASIFGRAGGATSAWASRVFVEDAALLGDTQGVSNVPRLPKILSSPKPTTFQHYVNQDSAWSTGRRSDLQHWDSPAATIRGYKFYWHQPGSGDSWVDADPKRSPTGDSQGGPIRPVPAGSRFAGRLRFENLTGVELGALLFALELPAECRHRLGMGKPLGLGSVKVEIALRVDHRVARYQRLFDGTSPSGRHTWHEPMAQDAPSAQAIKEQFARWRLEQSAGQAATTGDPVAEVWTRHLLPLKALLTWQHALAPEVTAYMPLDGFNGRPLLPDALTVIDWRARAEPTPPSEPASATSPMPRQPSVARPSATAASAKGGTPAREPPTTSLDALLQKFGSPPKSAPRPAARTKEDERARRDQQRMTERLRGVDPNREKPRP